MWDRGLPARPPRPPSSPSRSSHVGSRASSPPPAPAIESFPVIACGIAGFQPASRPLLRAYRGSCIWDRGLPARIPRRTKGRTPERPFMNCFTQAGPNRVAFNVLYRRMVMLLVPDVPVEVVRMPEITGSLQHLVRLIGGEGFPGVQNRGHAVVFKRREKHVYVVGHDDPGMHSISLAIEFQESLLNRFCDARVLKPDISFAFRQVEIKFRRHVFQSSSSLGTDQFILPSLLEGAGQRTDDSEVHGLRDSLAIEMGQVPSGVPSLHFMKTRTGKRCCGLEARGPTHAGPSVVFRCHLRPALRFPVHGIAGFQPAPRARHRVLPGHRMWDRGLPARLPRRAPTPPAPRRVFSAARRSPRRRPRPPSPWPRPR